MPPVSEDEAALLRTILAHPSADLPRLVYADWLEERAQRFLCTACGGTATVDRGRGKVSVCPACTLGYVTDGKAERAEFIRVQVDCTERGLDMGFEEWKALADRASALLAEYGRKWSGLDLAHVNGNSQPTRPPDACAVWARGFIDRVRCPLWLWVGGICPECRGAGNDVCCFACDATGAAPARGPAVVAGNPVERLDTTTELEVGDRLVTEAVYRFFGPEWEAAHLKKYEHRLLGEVSSSQSQRCRDDALLEWAKAVANEQTKPPETPPC